LDTNVIFVYHKILKPVTVVATFRCFTKGPCVLIVPVFKNVLNIFRRSLRIVGCCKPYVWAHYTFLFWLKCFGHSSMISVYNKRLMKFCSGSFL